MMVSPTTTPTTAPTMIAVFDEDEEESDRSEVVLPEVSVPAIALTWATETFGHALLFVPREVMADDTAA